MIDSTPLISKGSIADLEEKNSENNEKKKTLDSILTLKNIDVQIKKGQLVCVIGDVGSGKTSFLQALIGDLLYVSPNQILKYGGIQGLQKEIKDSEQIESF